MNIITYIALALSAAKGQLTRSILVDINCGTNLSAASVKTKNNRILNKMQIILHASSSLFLFVASGT